jgi:AcrR family transcriptional regulator
VTTPRIHRTAAESPQPPARRARTRRYACGDDTRRRILEVAIELFAHLGYAGASTRAIAHRARVSLPALQYYFGGKPGLYRACIEYITEDVRARLEPPAEQAQRALGAEPLTRQQLLHLLRGLIEPLLEGLASERPESWALFFARAQSEQNEALEGIHERIGGRLVTLLTEIVGRLLGEAAAPPEPRVRAVAIVAQIMLVGRARPLMLRSLGWPNFAGERLATLKSVLWRSIEASLGGP